MMFLDTEEPHERGTGEPAAGTRIKKKAAHLTHGNVAQHTPKGGLVPFLTRGEKVDIPKFGDIAVFWWEGIITHAAIVLGTSQDNMVYLIQKINQSLPYAVTPVDNPVIKNFGTPVYYRR